MTRTYEAMFLVDNDAVRADGWKGAKSSVTSLLQKHGGKVLCARRWDERRLAYPIRHKNRATYLLSYCEFAPEALAGLRRDLDISETVMRYLILSAEAVPPKEHELAALEESADFQVPEPPPDDHVPEPEPEPEGAEGKARSAAAPASEGESSGEGESSSDSSSGEKSESQESTETEKDAASKADADDAPAEKTPEPVAAASEKEEG